MKTNVACLLLLLFLTQCDYTSKPASNKTGSPNSNSQAPPDNQKGQTIRWETQGITFTVPSDWRKDESISDDEKKTDEKLLALLWRGPRDQSIEFTVDTPGDDFPAPIEVMLERDYESSKSNPYSADLHYQEAGGVKGLYYSTHQDDDRIKEYWLTYRHHKGKAQMVGVSLKGPKADRELLMTIFKSLKLEHD